MNLRIREYAGGVGGNQRHNAVQILVGHDGIDQNQRRTLTVSHHRLQLGEVLLQGRWVVADVRDDERLERKPFPTAVEAHSGSRADYGGDDSLGIRQTGIFRHIP